MVTRKNQFDFDLSLRKNSNLKNRNSNLNDGNGNLKTQNSNTKVLSDYCTILYDFRNGNPNEEWKYENFILVSIFVS